MPKKNNPFQKEMDSNAPIDLSLFCHIINDAHLAGTYQLEGNYFARTVTYLSRYIDSLPANETLQWEPIKARMQQLVHYEYRLKTIQNTDQLQRLAAELTENIVRQMTPYDVVTLPGGWGNKVTGHAMVYLIKMSQKGFDFHIYNDGEGISNHVKQSRQERELYSSVQVYHVPKPFNEAKIEAFLYQLLLAQSPHLQVAEDGDFDAPRLYQKIFSMLYGINKTKVSIKSTKEFQPVWSRGQLSGTCSQAVLHQLLKEAFADAKTYKQFIYQFKRYALDDFFLEIRKQPEHHVAVQNQIRHALRTLCRILTTDGLFTEEFAQNEHAHLKPYWEELAAIRINNSLQIENPKDTSQSITTKFVITFPRINNSLQVENSKDASQPITTKFVRTFPKIQFTNELLSPHHINARLHPKLNVSLDPSNLLTELNRISIECKKLIRVHQYADVVEGLEQLFALLPLPSLAQSFDTSLDFYQNISKENQGQFYCLMKVLKNFYDTSCIHLGGGVALPRKFATHLSIMSVLDYIQNRLSMWNSLLATQYEGTLHGLVVSDVAKLFKNKENNPQLATNNPLLDKRLHHIRLLYQKEHGHWHVNASRVLLNLSVLTLSLPIAYCEIFYHFTFKFLFYRPNEYLLNKYEKLNTFKENSLAYYMNIIDSEPHIKNQLEAYYDSHLKDNTPSGVSIDQCLNFYGCKSLYVLHHYRSVLQRFPGHQSLLRKLEEQESLEDGLFSVFNSDHDAKIGLFVRPALRYFADPIFGLTSRAYRTCNRIEDPINLLKFAKYAVKESSLLGKIFEENSLSDNAIQLKQHVNNPDALQVYRQYHHLRQASSLQIKETLHYFKNHLDQLSDKDSQIYLEANLFQPILLLNELDKETTQNQPHWTQEDNVLVLVEDFINTGLLYHIQRGQCTQTSLFLVRLAYLVYSYADKYTKKTLRLNMLHEKLRILIDNNQDVSLEIKHTLYQYQFLTATALLQLQEGLDEALIKVAFIAFFQTNRTANIHIKSDLATQFDLACENKLFGHYLQSCSALLLKELVHAVIQLIEPTSIVTLSLNNQLSYYVTTPHNSYQVDLLQGLVFNNAGWTFVSTPLPILRFVQESYEEAEVPLTCFLHIDKNRCEMGVPNPIYRYIADQLSHPYLEKLWEVNGRFDWYMLLNHEIHLDETHLFADQAKLPSVLMQKGNSIWLNNQQKNSFIITKNKRPIYRYDAKTKEIYQLDENGCDNGYSLCTNQSSLHDMFKHFDDKKHIIICKNAANQYHIELARYGIILKASSNRKWSFLEKWHFYLQDNPSYRLLTDEAKAFKCMELADLKNIPVLIFEDTLSQQRRCYIPLQSFIATEHPSMHSEFYHLKLDTNNEVARHILQVNGNKEIDKLQKWVFYETEQFVSMSLNKNNELVPESNHDALYLAYLYLGNHAPEKTWRVLNAIAKQRWGLKGTAQDIHQLYKIIHEVPFDGKNTKAVPATPPYIACQLKALALLVCISTPNHKITLGKQREETIINDIVYNKHLENREQFYQNLSQDIYQLYTRYQRMQRDNTFDFYLTDAEKWQLLDYYHQHLAENQKLMGVLGKEYQTLKLKQLIKEKTVLDAQRRINGNLPWSYEQRLQEISIIIANTHEINGHSSDIERTQVNFLISDLDKNVVKEFFENKSYSLFYVPTAQELEEAMAVLSAPHLAKERFIERAHLYFRVLITSSQPVLRKNLIDFCGLYLLQNRDISLAKKSKDDLIMWYLCKVYYQTDYWLGLYIRNLYFVFLLFDGFAYWLPKYDINFNHLLTLAETLPLPKLYFYEPIEQFNSALPLNIASLEQENSALHMTMTSKSSHHPQYFTFEKMIETFKFKDALNELAKAYRVQANQFDSVPSYSIDDFEAERKAGVEQYQALLEMKRIAQLLLGKSEYKNGLQHKAIELAHQLDELIKRRLQLALNLANSGFEASAQEKLRKELAINSGMKGLLTKEKLLILYLKADKSQYALETGLSDTKIVTLHFYLNTYIALSVRLQTLNRFIDKVKTLNGKSSSTDMQLAVHELLAQDLVDYTQEPLLAFFQYYENVLLRPQQKATLSRMLKTTDGFSYAEVIEKIIMGGGKSKIILPLLAKNKATGSNLVVIEVPWALFETNLADLSSTSLQIFDQHPFPFYFDRQTSCSRENLAHLYAQLSAVITNKHYVVTTGEAMQSLELKYLELLLEAVPEVATKRKIWEEQVTYIEKLVELFRTRADAVIDEVHHGLLLKKKLNYTLEKVKSLPSWLIQKTVDLYHFFEKVPLVNNDTYSFADLLNNNHLLIHDRDWEQALAELTRLLLTHHASPLNDVMNQLNPPVNEEDKALLFNYLMNRTQQIPDIVLNSHSSTRNIWALYKEQLSHLLPMTLRKNLNEHYGASNLQPELEMAIPYLGNNEPNETSRFGHYLVSMNYTIQMMLLQGVSKKNLHLYLSHLREKANLELLKDPQLQTIDHTPTGQRFGEMAFPLSQINLKDNALFEEIFLSLRHNQNIICLLLKNVILQRQMVDTEILFSDSHTHVDIYRSCQGLTGTPDFHTTWHSRLKFDKQNFAATNGFIIHVLKEKAPNVHALSNQSELHDYLHALLNERRSIHAILDICAAFKGKSNELVAKALASYLKEKEALLRYVMFFNRDNQLCALNIQKCGEPIVLNSSDPITIDRMLGCGPEYRFTYYDQVHTVGTDLKQASFAKALALIDHKTHLQSFLQGIMRMRGLADEQGIDIVVPMALKAYSLNDLLSMMESNQTQQLMLDNFNAAKSQMRNVARAHLIQCILKASSIHEKQTLIKQYKSFFVCDLTEPEGFFERYGQTISMCATQIQLERYRDIILNTDPELSILKQKLDEVIERALPLCEAAYLAHSRGEGTSEVEVQNQVESQEQILEEEQALQMVNTGLAPMRYKAWHLSPGKQIYSPLNQFYSLKQIIGYDCNNPPDFGEIYVTSNYFQTYLGQSKYVNFYLKPIHALLFRKSVNGHLDCVILSQREAQELALGMEKQCEPNIWIANTAMTVLAGSPPMKIRSCIQYQALIEQVRFFSGELNLLLKGDIPLQWLAKDTEKKKEYFQTHLFCCRETKMGEVDELIQALQTQQMACDWIAQHPELDYTQDDWHVNILVFLNEQKVLPQSHVHLIQAHSLCTITQMMGEQPEETFIKFLSSNQFKTNASQLKKILNSVDNSTRYKIINVLPSLPDVSEEVKMMISEEKTLSYEFYFNCLQGIALASGGAMLILGILTLTPLLAVSGGVMAIMAGVGLLLSNTGIFSNQLSALSGTSSILDSYF